MKANGRIFFVGILALIIVAIVHLQHRKNLQLQKQLGSFADQLTASEAARQTAQEKALDSAASVEQLQTGLSELPLLRGEVAALRRELAERDATLAKLQVQTKIGDREKDQPKPAIRAFGTDVRDFGAATPERAATSLIWAATSGERERFSELLELPANVPDTEAAAHFEYFATMLSNNFSRFQFTEIKSVRPNPDGTLRLGIMYRDPETGKTNPFPFMMRQHETGWKVVVEGAAPNKM